MNVLATSLAGPHSKPKVRRNRRLSMCLLVTTLVGTALVQGTAAQAETRVPRGTLFSRPNYDYAPSVIREGNIEKFWWCGIAPISTGGSGDVIFYRHFDHARGTWSATTKVLWPLSGWNKKHVCDPSVITGHFRNPDNGVTYPYAMYFTGTDDEKDEGRYNRVGVAYSQNGTNWVQYHTWVISPFRGLECPDLTYDDVNKTRMYDCYGAGQPATYNGDGRAGIWLFHTDTTRHLQPGGGRVYVRHTDDGVNFGPPTELSRSGAKPDTDSDFAYDPVTGRFYAAIGDPGRPGDRERSSFGIFRMPAQDLLAGGGTWERLTSIGTPQTGYYLNFSPAFMRDRFGNLSPWLPMVQTYFGAGTNDPGTWELTWANWRP